MQSKAQSYDILANKRQDIRECLLSVLLHAISLKPSDLFSDYISHKQHFKSHEYKNVVTIENFNQTNTQYQLSSENYNKCANEVVDNVISYLEKVHGYDKFWSNDMSYPYMRISTYLSHNRCSASLIHVQNSETERTVDDRDHDICVLLVDMYFNTYSKYS